jgi:hypothetical protein
VRVRFSAVENLNALVERLLASDVATIDDLGMLDLAWDVTVAHEMVRVKAMVRTPADTPEGAFQIALRLRDTVLGDDLELRQRARLIVVNDGADKAHPPWHWWGGVDLGVVQRQP